MTFKVSFYNITLTNFTLGTLKVSDQTQNIHFRILWDNIFSIFTIFANSIYAVLNCSARMSNQGAPALLATCVKTQHVFKNMPKLDTQFITFFSALLQGRRILRAIGSLPKNTFGRNRSKTFSIKKHLINIFCWNGFWKTVSKESKWEVWIPYSREF